MIVFEGIDRSGKSTMVKQVYEWVSVYPGNTICTTIRFPNTTTPIGQMLDSYIKTTSTRSAQSALSTRRCNHLLFVANRWEQQDYIRDLRAKGSLVLCDRYSASGIAYGVANGLDLEWCKTLEQGLIEPDLTIYLKLSLKEQSERKGFGNDVYETTEIQSKVKDVYEDELLYTGSGRWVVIDADREEDEVFEDVMRAIEKVVQVVQKIKVKNTSAHYNEGENDANENPHYESIRTFAAFQLFIYKVASGTLSNTNGCTLDINEVSVKLRMFAIFLVDEIIDGLFYTGRSTHRLDGVIVMDPFNPDNPPPEYIELWELYSAHFGCDIQELENIFGGVTGDDINRWRKECDTHEVSG